METRILIPEPLSVVTSPTNSYNLKEKKSKRNFQDEKKDEIQKPTSSSGLIEEEEEEQDSDDNNSDSSTTSEELASVDNSSCGSESNNSKSSESIVSSVNRNSNNKRQKSANKKCSLSKEQEKKDHSDNEIVSSADTKSKLHLNSYYSKYSLQSEEILRKKPFVKICANQIIEKGTTFSPNDGEVRVAFLNKALSQFPPDDIRFVFGCFDRITEDPLDDDKEIRLCNWIRFVKRAKDKYQDGVNVLARFSDRQPIFELTQTLLPGTELFVFFDIESIAQMNDRASKEDKDARNLHKGPGGNKPDVPLDLSKAPLEKPKMKSGSTLVDFKVFSSQSPVPSAEKHFSGKAKSPTIFSINNVLQPIKLFQPYSISHHSSAHSRSSREYSRTPPSNVSGGILSSNHHHNNSGLLATTPSSIGSSSPSATNSPTLRPILRTRGRERSLLPCDVCGKAFDRPSLLKRHMRTHTGEKPHICDVCSKGFSTSSSLNTHRRIHSGEKPHQCPICGKRFTASSNLYYHRMTHNKEKPHKCLLCGKSFPTPGDLKSHQYVHSGSWPFNCPICHRGFSKQTNLRNHLLLHSGTGDKPHNCQICGKKFALACNLRAHLRTHEEDPISSCISCKRTFLSSLNMLVNGQCRSCILHQNVNVNTNINITTNNNNNSSNQADISKSKNSGGINLELVPVSNHNFTHSLTTSPSSLSATVSSDVSQSLGNLTALQVPTAAIAPLPAFLPTHPSPLFHGAITDGMSGFNRPNPFLEQLFEWNYRFAKETAGNLGLHFQQKLLESQMLAAQLMSVSNSQGMTNIGIGISDILRLRSQEFPTVDVASVNKFAQQ